MVTAAKARGPRREAARPTRLSPDAARAGPQKQLVVVLSPRFFSFQRVRPLLTAASRGVGLWVAEV
jgi:hypothetical protein